MSVMTLSAMGFEELESLQAPSLIGAITSAYHTVAHVVSVVYHIVEKVVVVVTAYTMVKTMGG